MPAKVLQSGITPAVQSLPEEIAATANRLGFLLAKCAEDAMQTILGAQNAAVERLEAFVPQDRLLTLKEAAAYLGYEPRTLQSWTQPGSSPLVQYTMLGGEKRFRKAWLDAAVESGAVKPRTIKL